LWILRERNVETYHAVIDLFDETLRDIPADGLENLDEGCSPRRVDRFNIRPGTAGIPELFNCRLARTRRRPDPPCRKYLHRRLLEIRVTGFPYRVVHGEHVVDRGIGLEVVA
jgi:hypothetical protein